MLDRVVATALLLLSLGAMLAATACSRAASREELERVWQELLREERYEIVSFHRESSEPMVIPTDDQSLVAEDITGAYLWGLGGISGGGGWQIKGRLEEEVKSSRKLIQLYSKSVKYASPGFLFIPRRWDPDQYPLWEFLLVLRDAANRKQLQLLWSTEFGPQAVVPATRPGERHPRGELRYDPVQRTATVKILGIKDPITAEVPIPGIQNE